MKEFFSNRRGFFSGVVSIVLSVAFVASITFASTTISTNISTGGTLSVTGASTFTGIGTFAGQLQASSTSLFGGAVTAYSTLAVTSDFNVNGLATTTASTGNFGTLGKIGVGTTSPTTLEISAQGAGTTTIAAFSSGSSKGSCLQLQGPNGNLYRLYATTTGPAIIEIGSCK